MLNYQAQKVVGKLLKTNEMLSPGLDIIRIISGGIIFTYGLEIFDGEQIGGYTQWLTDVGVPWSETMAYLGKLAELICGIFLAIGLLTRLSTIPLITVMFSFSVSPTIASTLVSQSSIQLVSQLGILFF